MHLAEIFLPRRITNILKELRTNGFVLLPNYFPDRDLDHIETGCHEALDSVVGVDGPPDVVKRMPGSIRVTNLHRNNFYFDYFRRDLMFLLVGFCVSGRFGWPSVMYSITHDGKFKHPAVPGKAEQPFANRWHFDGPFHNFKAVVFLDDVTSKKNGPTLIIPGSVKLNWKTVKLYSQRIANNKKSKEEISLKDEEFDDDLLKDLISRNGSKPVLGQRGDVLLFDSRIIHRANELTDGCRRLLWYYY